MDWLQEEWCVAGEAGEAHLHSDMYESLGFYRGFESFVWDLKWDYQAIEVRIGMKTW